MLSLAVDRLMNRGEIGGLRGTMSSKPQTDIFAWHLSPRAANACSAPRAVHHQTNNRRWKLIMISSHLAVVPDSMELWPPETIMICPGIACRRPTRAA